uniref:cysteine-rich venom protein latisemin-like n=1 Tax=Euleptes europaea TaxID=460621 RepID=UPI0025410E01|nr:cysteine-rich venom protein latisemin-like [Euleptes europaea]
MAVTVVLMISLAAVLQPSAGQGPIASLSTDRADQQKEITNKHNALRRSVKPSASNMLRMEWSPAAAENAKRWAQQCNQNHSPSDKRTVNGIGCGENLYMSTAPNSWSKAIDAWFSEVKDFRYGQGSVTGAQTGHYTQLTWYRSYLLGCAVAHCPRSRFAYYFVCHYCPAGNIIGSINKPYKSGRPCADCPNACDNGLCTNPCKHDDKYSNCADLKRSPGCNNAQVKEWCPASCQCTTEIK